jgi:hypothetical protein
VPRQMRSTPLLNMPIPCEEMKTDHHLSAEGSGLC